MEMKEICIAVILFVALSVPALAGPPWDTDDPEPVGYGEWEFYFASRPVHTETGWNGTAPHAEANYGAIKNLHLHVQIPLNFNLPKGETSAYGVGDVELGLKYRLIKETSSMPSVGIFPALCIPTGNQNKQLGNGATQVYLPLWIQKNFGNWTTYGGGGYRINNAEGRRNSLFLGWLIQNHITEKLTVGVELYRLTAESEVGSAENRFNFGTTYDLSEKHHLLLSAGRSFHGGTTFQAYIGYQLVLGSK